MKFFEKTIVSVCVCWGGGSETGDGVILNLRVTRTESITPTFLTLTDPFPDRAKEKRNRLSLLLQKSEFHEEPQARRSAHLARVTR